MYVSSPTWIESGPVPGLGAVGPRVIPIPSVYRMKRIARRGMGSSEYSTTGKYSLSQGYCDSAWSLLNPVAWLGGCAEADVNNVKAAVANKYEQVQYGHIPRPSDLPAPPVGAPLDAKGNPTLTPAQQMEQWRAGVTSAIQTAEDTGAYNPAGNLPFNAIDFQNFWNRYGTALTILGVGVLGYVGWKVATK